MKTCDNLDGESKNTFPCDGATGWIQKDQYAGIPCDATTGECSDEICCRRIRGFRLAALPAIERSSWCGLCNQARGWAVPVLSSCVCVGFVLVLQALLSAMEHLILACFPFTCRGAVLQRRRGWRWQIDGPEMELWNRLERTPRLQHQDVCRRQMHAGPMLHQYFFSLSPVYMGAGC